MTVQKQDDQHEHTFSNYVRILDVVQKTCLRRWTIGKSGERGSGISVLPARHDDDDIYIYIYIYTFNLSFLREYFVDKIFDLQHFICLHTIKWFQFIIFSGINPVSLRKHKTSFILTLSSKSVERFSLKNSFLMRAKELHSMRTCLTVQGIWRVKHCACCSCFCMKEWVSLVWPMCNRNITIYPLLDFLKAGIHPPKVGWIWKNLLWVLLFQCYCHFVWRGLLISGYKSV